MAVKRLSISEFVSMMEQYPILDVRSPSEYAHAHMKNAYSLPLFTDEERKVVGTAYKQQGKQPAIKLGLNYFGVKMTSMVTEVEALLASSSDPTNKVVLVHCWRGGMRSAGVAWLLDLYGYTVYTLVGGYKAYRNWVLAQFTLEYTFKVIGGYTGSGKTETLHTLGQLQEPIIDLEGLAHHKGSAFGNLGQPVQPSQEQFENLLAQSLYTLGATPRYIWVEDESRRIGLVNIPSTLFDQIRKSKLYFLDIPFTQRLQFILQGYGKFEKDKLMSAILRIKKRLGGLETKTAINFLIEDDVESCFKVLLHYYDKLYLKGAHNRENVEALIHKIEVPTVDAAKNAATLLTSSGLQ
ncbi:MAG: tRNA 2-selenouridine(34) synthase MnmH [Bacteroidota bacterium]|jgi:tRNA 2-selenouridine synthase